MNRIEIAAGNYGTDLTPLVTNNDALSVSCTPAIVVATLVGTFAGAAVCYKVVYGFDAGTPDAAGDPGAHPLLVSDLLSARQDAIANSV